MHPSSQGNGDWGFPVGCSQLPRLSPAPEGLLVPSKVSNTPWKCPCGWQGGAQLTPECLG